jgi:hypothetical protein
MAEPAPIRRPRFAVGDEVRTIGPGAPARGMRHGKIIEIIEGKGNPTFRYRVRFEDGSDGTYFGFELDRIHPA